MKPKTLCEHGILCISLFLFVNAKQVFSQNNPQSKVIISGYIQGLEEGSKVWILANERFWKDSVIVHNESFTFRLPITEPASYNIRLSREWEPNKWEDFYVNDGEITIQAKNGSFTNLTTGGSQYAMDLDVYRKYIMPVWDSVRRRRSEGNISAAESKKLDSFSAAASANWAMANRNSEIAPYILYNIQRTIYSKKLETLLNELPATAEKTIFVRNMRREINALAITALGQIIPDFTQADTSGIPVSIKDFRGKYVLIDFWASWCVPCREENPNLKKAFDKWKNNGFTILGVSLDNNRENWKEAIKQDSLNWTHVSDLNFWDNILVKLFGIHSVPANFLLDPDGKIIAKNLRGDNLETKLVEVIK